MNWLSKIAQKVFLGSCIHCLEDPEFPFSDATELAQIVEGGREISKEQFLSMCQVDKDTIHLIHNDSGRYSFFVNGIAWAYDDRNDIHYFYG